MIEPAVDKYGKFARASFFADYMELAALRAGRVKLASVRDLIADTYPLLRQGFIAEDAEPDSDWKPSNLADEVWTSLLERADLLGDKYPFDARGGVLRDRRLINPLDSPYVSLLAISLAHAFKLCKHNFVETLMEEVVAVALEKMGFSVSRLAANARTTTGKFEAATDALFPDLGIRAKHNAAVRRAHANDEGVDLVAHADWGVRRAGRWLYVGQVTCAISDDWRKKASEPVVTDWQKFLVEVVEPIAFLAVPHHADKDVFSYVSSVGVRVLDRTRIAAALQVNSPAQRNIIQRVLSEDYQSFAV